MNEALKRHEQETSNSTVRWEILEYLAYSTFMQGTYFEHTHSYILYRSFFIIAGNLKKALDLTIELLSILPNHERALGNLAYYEAAIKNGTTEIEKSEQWKKSGSTMLDPEERDRYHMLCRNENLMAVKLSSQLRCRYTDNNKNPRLLIAPLKEEEAYLSPRIILYRDVLYDNEIEIIQHMAQPRVSIYFQILN